MICPKCKNNHKKSYGLRCNCGYWFVFRPDVDSGMTDNKFLSLVRKASADNRYYFTFSQLYYFCRTMKGKIHFSSICSIVTRYIFFGFFAFIFFSEFWPLVFFLIALTAFIHSTKYYYSPPNREELRRLVKKWSRSRCSYVKGTLDKMIVKPSLHKPPPEFPEGDLYDYGVERIIIVERKILVDLLVKNGFHTEQRALIFSVDGYPSYIEEQSKKLLQASPELPIYLLHDATEEGMAMRKKIKIPTSHKVVDLGMSPDQLQNFPTLKPLRLQEQGYNAPLDVLPYAALSAMGTAAIAAGIPFDEVLVSWKREGNSVGDSSVSSYG